VPADATECSPFTDAGLTRSERSPPASIAVIADDRLLTVADICGCCRSGSSVVYRACDAAISVCEVEGAVQVEGRDLNAGCSPSDRDRRSSRNTGHARMELVASTGPRRRAPHSSRRTAAY